MDNAIKSGITRFTRVAIRLVPDAYGDDNQQGWWDDRHWARYGDKMSTEGSNHVEPYMTTQSWAENILCRCDCPKRKASGFLSGQRM